MSQRAKPRKESIVRSWRAERNLDDLRWVSRDIAAMQRQEQFKLPLRHIWEILNVEELRKKLFIEERSRLEGSRERQNPREEPKTMPTVLLFSQLKRRQLAVKYTSGRFPQVSTTLMVHAFGARVHESFANALICKSLLGVSSKLLLIFREVEREPLKVHSVPQWNTENRSGPKLSSVLLQYNYRQHASDIAQKQSTRKPLPYSLK